jgi:hypothetical protein
LPSADGFAIARTGVALVGAEVVNEAFLSIFSLSEDTQVDNDAAVSHSQHPDGAPGGHHSVLHAPGVGLLAGRAQGPHLI